MGEAGIATTVSSSRLECDSRRLHSETTKLIGGIRLELGLGLNLSGLCTAGVVASGAQWRFGIFTVGPQMAIKLNQVKSGIAECTLQIQPSIYLMIYKFMSVQATMNN